MSKEIKLVGFSILAIFAVVFLYTRPKVVIKDDAQTTQKTNEKTPPPKESVHELSEGLKAKLQTIRSTKESQSIIFNNIGLAFAEESVFDSAGYYFEKLVKVENTLANTIKAADMYNQAFSLGLDPIKNEQYAEKARTYYGQAMAIDPSNLYAKTNLASTYVKSQTPMKAITMLREVLDVNPNYVPAILSLGGLSMQSNQYDKAVLRFQKVLSLDANNVNAKLGLAYSYLETNKKAEAKGIFQALLKSDINQVMKDEVTKTLNTLK